MFRFQKANNQSYWNLGIVEVLIFVEGRLLLLNSSGQVKIQLWETRSQGLK